MLLTVRISTLHQEWQAGISRDVLHLIAECRKQLAYVLSTHNIKMKIYRLTALNIQPSGTARSHLALAFDMDIGMPKTD